MELLQGKALVAAPGLMDPNFLRSVVYILQHGSDGAFGLVLNRPTAMTVADLLEQLGEVEIESEAPVFSGGPCDGPLLLLQMTAADDSEGSGVEVRVSSEQSQIAGAVNDSGNSFRIFEGYSGWGPGQLESELEAGGWLVWEIPLEQIFADSDVLWQTAVNAIGRDILLAGIQPAQIPDDPAFN